MAFFWSQDYKTRRQISSSVGPIQISEASLLCMQKNWGSLSRHVPGFASGQCNTDFYLSNLLQFHGNTVILCYNYHGIAVNYQGKNIYNTGPYWET
jgi:hypothetical protein